MRKWAKILELSTALRFSSLEQQTTGDKKSIWSWSFSCSLSSLCQCAQRTCQKKPCRSTQNTTHISCCACCQGFPSPAPLLCTGDTAENPCMKKRKGKIGSDKVRTPREDGIGRRKEGSIISQPKLQSLLSTTVAGLGSVARRKKSRDEEKKPIKLSWKGCLYTHISPLFWYYDVCSLLKDRLMLLWNKGKQSTRLLSPRLNWAVWLTRDKLTDAQPHLTHHVTSESAHLQVSQLNGCRWGRNDVSGVPQSLTGLLLSLRGDHLKTYILSCHKWTQHWRTWCSEVGKQWNWLIVHLCKLVMQVTLDKFSDTETLSSGEMLLLCYPNMTLRRQFHVCTCH